jgi:hypothetical protein
MVSLNCVDEVYSDAKLEDNFPQWNEDRLFYKPLTFRCDNPSDKQKNN